MQVKHPTNYGRQPLEEKQRYADRYKDLVAHRVIFDEERVEVYGRQLDGTPVWLLIHLHDGTVYKRSDA